MRSPREETGVRQAADERGEEAVVKEEDEEAEGIERASRWWFVLDVCAFMVRQDASDRGWLAKTCMAALVHSCDVSCT